MSNSTLHSLIKRITPSYLQAPPATRLQTEVSGIPVSIVAHEGRMMICSQLQRTDDLIQYLYASQSLFYSPSNGED